MALTMSHGGETTFKSSSPSNEILVGTKEGVVRVVRETGSADWQVADRWLTDKHIHALVIDPASSAIVAGATEDSVHVSEDGGTTWERRDNGLTETDVYSLAAARTNGTSRIYAGTEPAHLFCSDDLGRNWMELPALRKVDMSSWTFPAPPHLAHTKHINFHPTDPNTMFVSIEQGGLLKSTDGGESFTIVSGMDDDVHRTAIDPQNPDQIYLTGGAGTYVTSDGGTTWQHRTDTKHEIGGYPDFVLVHPKDTETIFITAAETQPGEWGERGTTGSRVSKSTDRGNTWTQLRNGLPDRLKPSFQAVILEDWGESFSIYGATVTGEVWASEDGGESWAEIVTGLPPISKGMHYALLGSA